MGATGADDIFSAPQALAYNGKTWSREKVPGAKGDAAEFTDVSCPSVRLCVALGSFQANPAGGWTSLAGFWNGKTWRLAAA